MSSGSITIDGRFDNRRLKKGLAQTEGILVKFGKKVTRIFIGVGLVILARKFFSLGKLILQNYKDQIAAESRLAAVIRATGEAAGFTIGEMKQLANHFQILTGVADDLILNMFGVISTFKNIRGDHFTQAAQAALDLSEVLQQDLKSSALQVAKALNDPIRGITALSRAGVSFTAKQKAMIKSLMETGNIIEAQKIILNELKSEFGGAAEAVTDTTRRYDSLKNRMGDAAEVATGALQPAFERILDVVEALTRALEIGAGEMKSYSVEIAGLSLGVTMTFALLDQALMGIIVAIIGTMKFFGIMWDTIKVTAAQIALAVISMGNDIVHVLRSVIIGGLMWLSTNWVGIFINIAKALETITTNMLENMRSFMLQMMSLISGGTFNWTWTPLLLGFENTLTALPEIAKRELTATEAIAQASINSMSAKLAANSINFQKDVAKEAGIVKAAIDAILGSAGAPEGSVPEGDNDPFTVDPEKDKKKKKRKEKDKDRLGQLENLSSTYERILQASAGRKIDPVEEAIKSLKKPLEDLPMGIAKAITSTAMDIGEAAVKLQLSATQQLVTGVMELVTGGKEQKTEQEKSNSELAKLNKKKGIVTVQ